MTDAQLKAFVAVADYGSFTRAAKHLRMSQSGVSHAIAGLEASLQVTLLRRSATDIRLTDIGARTVVHARKVLQLKAVILQEAEATQGLRRGTVRVGSFGVSASRRLLPSLMEVFIRRYPDIAVRVVEGSDQEIEQWLRVGKVEVGFVTLPHDDFDTLLLTKDEMSVVLPTAHPLAAEAHIRPDQLGGYPFIMSTGGCEPAIQDITRNVALDVRYRIREVGTIAAMVEQGLGVSIKPSLALPDPLPEGVVCRPLEPRCQRQVGLAVLKRSEASPACKAFLKVAEQHRQSEVVL